jgi:hypothetical protein
MDYGRPAMSEMVGMPGELLFEQVVKIIRVANYGVDFDSLLSGGKPPAEGARFDIYLEGIATGPKLKGVVKSVDYSELRADGNLDLDYHSEITTEDGDRVAIKAGGVVRPDATSPIAQLRVNGVLRTSAAKYKWLDRRLIWAPGTVDFAKREIRFAAYAV